MTPTKLARFRGEARQGEFVGREALLRRKEEGPRRRLSCLLLDDPSVVVMGSEPVYAEGRPVGYVASAAYGYSIGTEHSLRLAIARTLGGGPEGSEVAYFGERTPRRSPRSRSSTPAMKRMRG
jgi:glycine cleavage system aminomethyltransferase T